MSHQIELPDSENIVNVTCSLCSSLDIEMIANIYIKVKDYAADPINDCSTAAYHSTSNIICQHGSIKFLFKVEDKVLDITTHEKRTNDNSCVMIKKIR